MIHNPPKTWIGKPLHLRGVEEVEKDPFEFTSPVVSTDSFHTMRLALLYVGNHPFSPHSEEKALSPGATPTKSALEPLRCSTSLI